MGWGYGGFKPYVPVAKRRAQAALEVSKRIRKGEVISPIKIKGQKITSTFWGLAWCTNLESYSDFENRLPRGRTYVRNGSVVHLQVEKGRIKALVSGSELYEIQIEIAPLPANQWGTLKKQCVGQIASMVELLQGMLSKGVMEKVTDRDHGLFPKPAQIKMKCSCPDYAGMCKHLAAVMYGVGHRLDSSPELLFVLRGVDHAELIEQAIPAASRKSKRGAPTIAIEELGAIFDIDIEVNALSASKPAVKAFKKTSSKQPAKAAAPLKASAVVTKPAVKALKKTSTKQPAKAVTTSKAAARVTKLPVNALKKTTSKNPSKAGAPSKKASLAKTFKKPGAPR